MKKILRASILFAIVLIGEGIFAQKGEAKTVRYKDPIELFVGESKTVRLKKKHRNYRWTSAKKSVATVTKNGKITGKKPGKAKVTLKLGNSRYIYTVEVYKKPVIHKEYEIKVGDKFQLKVEQGGKITWKSGNKKVATVSKKGKVTGKSVGTAVITADTKLRVYKYKIYVTKPAGQIPDGDSSNTATRDPELAYQYTVSLLNSTYGVYNHCPYAIKVATNNPQAGSIVIECSDSIHYWNGDEYEDVIATGAADVGNHLIPVEGGYLLPVKFATAGQKSIVIKEKVGDVLVLAKNYKVDINSYEDAEQAWIAKNVELNNMDQMPEADRRTFAEQFVDKYFTVEKRTTVNLSETGPYWITKKITEGQKKEMIEKLM